LETGFLLGRIVWMVDGREVNSEVHTEGTLYTAGNVLDRSSPVS